ncbi:hypothetical protein SAMN05660199_00365 [Klenkia soli]|uniref:Meckel syndrome type 1 protein n=1 Tax=Klenkia soli TaxID=1052260 RepID=A0A1H0CP63_9ACTN|nr:hypothetical protein [Klenkia soli]SDN59615.1 hypothetical protein SAMN05660199_00365 [Klenkia soli]
MPSHSPEPPSGNTRDEAIAAAREEYGSDVRIRGVRRIRSGGVAGFFSQERFVADVVVPGLGDADVPAAPSKAPTTTSSKAPAATRPKATGKGKVGPARAATPTVVAELPRTAAPAADEPADRWPSSGLSVDDLLEVALQVRGAQRAADDAPTSVLPVVDPVDELAELLGPGSSDVAVYSPASVARPAAAPVPRPVAAPVAERAPALAPQAPATPSAPRTLATRRETDPVPPAAPAWERTSRSERPAAAATSAPTPDDADGDTPPSPFAAALMRVVTQDDEVQAAVADAEEHEEQRVAAEQDDVATTTGSAPTAAPPPPGDRAAAVRAAALRAEAEAVAAARADIDRAEAAAEVAVSARPAAVTPQGAPTRTVEQRREAARARAEARRSARSAVADAGPAPAADATPVAPAAAAPTWDATSIIELAPRAGRPAAAQRPPAPVATRVTAARAGAAQLREAAIRAAGELAERQVGEQRTAPDLLDDFVDPELAGTARPAEPSLGDRAARLRSVLAAATPPAELPAAGTGAAPARRSLPALPPSGTTPAAEQAAAEQAERAAVEAARLAAEQAEAQRVAAEQAEAQRAAAEQAEAERIAAERMAAEQAEARRAAARQAAAEAARVEARRIETELAEARRAAAAEAAAEAQRAEAQRTAAAEAQRLAAEQAATERAAALRVAAERAAAQRVEAQRRAVAEAERIAAEAERTAVAEAQRIAAERVAAEQIATARAEAQRAAAEAERVAAAERAAAHAARVDAEAEREAEVRAAAEQAGPTLVEAGRRRTRAERREAAEQARHATPAPIGVAPLSVAPAATPVAAEVDPLWGTPVRRSVEVAGIDGGRHRGAAAAAPGTGADVPADAEPVVGVVVDAPRPSYSAGSRYDEVLFGSRSASRGAQPDPLEALRAAALAGGAVSPRRRRAEAAGRHRTLPTQVDLPVVGAGRLTALDDPAEATSGFIEALQAVADSDFVTAPALAPEVSDVLVQEMAHEMAAGMAEELARTASDPSPGAVLSSVASAPPVVRGPRPSVPTGPTGGARALPPHPSTRMRGTRGDSGDGWATITHLTPVTDGPGPAEGGPAGLAALGVPPSVLGAGFAAEASRRGTFAALASALGRALPPAPAIPSEPGDVLVVVGPGAEALGAARALAVALRLDPSRVLWCTRGPLAGLAGADVQVSGAAAAADVRALLAGADVPTVIAVDVPLGDAGGAWAAQMVQAWDATAVWGVLDSTRKPAALRSWLAGLPRVDAVVVTDTDAAPDPAALLEGLPVPVAVVDGARATPHRWAALLCERLAGRQ